MSTCDVCYIDRVNVVECIIENIFVPCFEFFMTVYILCSVISVACLNQTLISD